MTKSYKKSSIIPKIQLPDMAISDPKTLGISIFSFIAQIKGQFLIIAPDYLTSENTYYALNELHLISGIEYNFEFYDEFFGNSKEINPNENRISKVLKDIHKAQKSIICSADAFSKKLPSLKGFKEGALKLQVGESYSFSNLSEKLAGMDYDNEIQVNNVCEFALRGGIIDVYSSVEEHPARIEFFGDKIESIRLFSPETQKTISKKDSYEIALRYSSDFSEDSVLLFEYFPSLPNLILVYPSEIIEKLPFDFSEFLERTEKENRLFKILRPIEIEDIGADRNSQEIALPIPDVFEGEDTAHISEIGKELYSHMRSNQVLSWLKDKYEILIFVETASGKKLLESWLERNSIPLKSIHFIEASLHDGFILPDSKRVYLSEKEIYFLPHKKNFNLKKLDFRKGRQADKGVIPELEIGDYVVHLLHGIGIYHGITEIESAGALKEVFELEYEGGVRLFVPVWQAYLLTRYVGTKKEIPSLSKVGSGRWSSVKEAAVSSARNLAAELLRIQALRLSTEGYAFSDDNEDMKNFESAFPFTETSDQLKAIADVKKDLINSKPMDRLICGDVGFGKTEVAMRAAFRSVMDGKQVAILTPTTILAQQHYYTFTERFVEHPVIIEVISRFKTPLEQRKILSDLADRKIDIIIGTHRLLQGDVNFADLGLLIIDEEQKFGVQHKEKLKRMRASVDILTMTATPIPRTLYFALSGLRDLSTIESAPVNRLPVQTILCKFDEGILTSAINNEVKRGGQVFFLHNRVKSIEKRASWLRNLLPEIIIAVAHGQMESDELEKVMSDFIDGKIDVLVCSTIIESGVDIPNANTIIIERADMFGLAELYQLRGRVGRWTKQAYAYLIIPDSAIISNTARERLTAIKKYTQLGAGFRLALKDLEIRGTGNILGSQQSGHINAVGFNLYCQLLKSSVTSLKKNKKFNVFYVDMFFDFIDFSLTPGRDKINACLPQEYINSEKLRVDFYIRASELWSHDEIEEFREELNDRFGKLPIETERFIEIIEIRIFVGSAGYNSISVKENHIYIEGPNSRIFLFNGKIPMLKSIEPDLKLVELKKYVKLNLNPS